MEERDADLNPPAADHSEVQIPAETVQLLAKLAHEVSTRQLELENAKLRLELAARKVVDDLTASGHRTILDLDKGVVRFLPASSRPK